MLPDPETARAARLICRDGAVAPTAGMAPGFTQCNMISLPRDWAWDFLLFGQRNPKPCPILDVTDPGDFRTSLAPDADLRRDIPLYRVWRDGELVDSLPDVTDLWAEQGDLVTFLIGCSFTFETPLQQAGIEVRHIAQGRNVPMFLTNRACRPAGRLHGNMVVSMRPIPADRVAEAAMISGRFPAVHGAPIHIGAPEALGITDLTQPDFGDPVAIHPGEVPVFWACGVTPQAAVMASRPPFAITHAPGHMFITDIPDSRWQI
ncbi:putative hydro-lyase [Paracoccus fistulariae]|uniref:Putative hydro-lyase JHX87_09660 n=1 Tax=Paracoccus fistulariae TaxID=658446 RepID=A0ABY7SH09_9RHOB|nr:putative hydro-lyase [Paracoccus fistulariae]MDB6181913.1 putative hydro-lyase [Paracoccus fistulariae]WCR05802.1 putative hydro-lyase [Paracoccus fistulariae]